jgi:hypothetical protein
VDTIGTKAGVRNSVGHGRALGHGKKHSSSAANQLQLDASRPARDEPKITNAQPGGFGPP